MKIRIIATIYLNNLNYHFISSEKFVNSQFRKGLMAERLGTGLQNRLQQFESAWDLLKTPDS